MINPDHDMKSAILPFEWLTTNTFLNAIYNTLQDSACESQSTSCDYEET